jgi:hypothetical protein
MPEEIEISLLDLRYENCRIKNPAAEERLFSSIAEEGIGQPLEGVNAGGACVLLDGFKRYRCARKLRIQTVPWIPLGEDEVIGIMNLLRRSEHRKALGILEEAAFVDELGKVGHMSVAAIALELSRSKAWVSMRLGLIAEMSPAVARELFRGRFPVYSYMYTLRRFMRMNGVTREQIEEFVSAVSGKKLSVREIEQLAHGFFRGPDSFREQILTGNLSLPLKAVREAADASEGCSEFERILLEDLERTGRYMQRVMGKSEDPRITSRAFHARAHLLSAGILSRADAFTRSMQQLHDRCGQA